MPTGWKALRAAGRCGVGVLQRKGLTCFSSLWWSWFTRRASGKPEFSQVAAKMLEAAVFGAYFNVTINLKDIADDKFKRVVSRAAPCPFAASGWLFWPDEWQVTRLVPIQMSQKVSGMLEEAKQGSAVVLALLDKRVA